MAREMFSFRIDSGLRDVLAARAERENRSVSNMAEVLLEAALTERGGGTVASPTGGSLATPPRSVSPADVAATVPGVTVGAPSGKCGYDTPRGTKCKLCGKVH